MGLCHLTTSIFLGGGRTAVHFEGYLLLCEGSSLAGKGWTLVVDGWALVVRKGWALVVRMGWALVVGKGWVLVGKGGRDVGVTAVKQELILLQVLTSIYTGSLSAPRPPLRGHEDRSRWLEVTALLVMK